MNLFKKQDFQRCQAVLSIWSTTQEAKNNFRVFSGSLKN